MTESLGCASPSEAEIFKVVVASVVKRHAAFLAGFFASTGRVVMAIGSVGIEVNRLDALPIAGGAAHNACNRLSPSPQ